MKKTAIVTDSNAGILPEEAEEKQIFMLPMPFMIDGKDYLENVNLTSGAFYQMMKENKSISTSQPAPGDVLALWDKVLEEYEELVYIPMSSGLSASCQSAYMLSKDYEGRVQVVDNRRISVTQKSAVYDALALAEKGKSASEIRNILELDGDNSSIYIMLDTLYYLKKGGRITPAAAAIGTVLRLKPVLQIQGSLLDAFAKARTINHAKTTMINAVRSDMENRFGGADPENCSLFIAHTDNGEMAMQFKAEVEAAFPGFRVDELDPLSLVISCHIGPGSLALACCKKLRTE
ncbi:MAG: DegV family protein [Lachnospiraceae bacterium]|jgi:DegV family protein with EDD domain|nr:DegV family protein [Lachnospiraceae bacterium]